MPYSWCGKTLGWARPLQPSGSAAATQEPVWAATDMGMALSFSFHDVAGISEEVYDVHNDGAYGASPPSLLEAGATISGGNRRTAKAVGAVAHSNAPPTTPSPLDVMAPTYTPVEKVCNHCARVCKCRRAHTPCVNDCRTGG